MTSDVNSRKTDPTYKFTFGRNPFGGPTRDSDYADVLSFAKRSMRTYEILAQKAPRWNADPEIQGLLKGINVADVELTGLTRTFTPEGAKKRLAAPLDRVGPAKAPLPYERLDQLTMEIPYGVR